MATAPTPIDFTQYEWALGDTTRMITQWNAMQAALTQYGQELVPFGSQMTSQMNAAISARQAAEAARDEAQEIVVGDTAITDLQPGALTSEGDFLSVDASGELAKRSLRDGSEPASLLRYDLASVATTATLNLAASNEFRVSANLSRTLTFVNAPSSGRSMCVVVRLYSINDSRTITWPSGISWADGTAPALEGSWMLVVLLYSSGTWYGSVGAKG